MSVRSYDARHRTYDARHRSSKSATVRPRRLIAGLALPTAAAAALTFTATGAAFATASHPATGNNNITLSVSSAPVVVSSPPVSLGESHSEARQANALAREHAAFSAARSSERQDIAARNLVAKRAAEAHTWQLPIKTFVLTSGYGARWGRLHAGEDFAAPVGTKLVAMSTGTVIFAGRESGYGNIVKIRYWDGTLTFYGHMSSFAVIDGESVRPGEIVGESGNTGESTGPHLHLEVHPNGEAAIDPLPWLAEHGIPA